MAQYHPEYLKAIEPLLPMLANVQKPAVNDVETRRTNIKALLGSIFGAIPLPPDVEITIHHVPASDGFSIPVYHYRKKDSATRGLEPAIVHTHGGGYIALDVATVNSVVAELAGTTGVQIFSVDYRLAPEHPFPIPIEDCYTGLKWVHEHATEFNVDSNRIAVYGESAGGGLAAGLAVMARDRKLDPPLAKQVLVYPMIDDRTLKSTPLDQLMFWNYEDNITGWTAYIGKEAGKDGTSPYAAAARVESVEGLPSTYIDVGTLDLFRDENIKYASRLAAANIEVEFHLYPGVPHAFEALARGTALVDRVVGNRVRALTSF